jgi:hypothetical protein
MAKCCDKRNAKADGIYGTRAHYFGGGNLSDNVS